MARAFPKGWMLVPLKLKDLPQIFRKGFFGTSRTPQNPKPVNMGRGEIQKTPPDLSKTVFLVMCNLWAKPTKHGMPTSVHPSWDSVGSWGCELKQGKPRQSFWGFGPPGHSGGTSLGRRGQGHGRVRDFPTAFFPLTNT